MNILFTEEDTLEALVSLSRSRTRLAIVDLLLKEGHPLTVKEISNKLKISISAISVALHHLSKAKIIERIQRGLYFVNSNAILRAILPLVTNDVFKRLLRSYKELLYSSED